MEHLDEGTIHAWLDGALSDVEARRAEIHTATCPQCAELLAEARGLIAGASRILTALDDVPAHVAPVHVADSVAPEDQLAALRARKSTDRLTSTRRRRNRMGVLAAAGILFVAAGSLAVIQRQSTPAVAVEERLQREDSLGAAPSARPAPPVVASTPARDSIEPAPGLARRPEVETRAVDARKRESGSGASKERTAADRVAQANTAPSPTPAPPSGSGVGQRAQSAPTTPAFRQVAPAAPVDQSQMRQSGSEAKQQVASAPPTLQKAAPEEAKGPARQMAGIAEQSRGRTLAAQRDNLPVFTDIGGRASLIGCYELQDVGLRSDVPSKFALDSTVAAVQGDSVWYNARAVNGGALGARPAIRWMLLTPSDTAGAQLVSRIVLLGTSEAAVRVRIVIGGLALAKTDARAPLLDRAARSAELTARPVSCPR